MRLEDFFKEDFAIFCHDDAPTLLISTTDRVRKFEGTIDKNNPPVEETLEVSKKKFAEEFKRFAEDMGYKALREHPCRFCIDFSIDMYRGEEITHATRLVKQWSELSDAN